MSTSPPEDFGWFTTTDLTQALQAITEVGAEHPPILVGGQALTAWVEHYKISIPDTGTPALTQDLDFLGYKREATFLAKHLSGSLAIPENFDPTPNSAIVTFIGPSGQRLLIDFLGCLHGLTNDEVEEKAVDLIVSGVRTKIMDPLVVLKSRLENLKGLSSKRNGNGYAQAKVAIDVAGAYLGELARDYSQRYLLNAIKQVFRIAASPAGVYCNAEYHLDPTTAIDTRLVKNPKFKVEEWPRQQARLAKSRARASKS